MEPSESTVRFPVNNSAKMYEYCLKKRMQFILVDSAAKLFLKHVKYLMKQATDTEIHFFADYILRNKKSEALVSLRTHGTKMI